MDTMFDTLLQLPLFQGLSHDDFTSILEKVKLHFTKHKAGDTIVKSGTLCDGLIFLLKGEVDMLTVSPDASYSLVEHFSAPYLLEPYSLFGMSTTYVSSYTARVETHTVRIDKKSLLNILLEYEIFRLNYLNILCNRVQMFSEKRWSVFESDLSKRISLFFLSLMERPFGEKVIRIKMIELAQLLQETRTTVSKELNDMQQKGLLELHRGMIVIPSAEKLISDF